MNDQPEVAEDNTGLIPPADFHKISVHDFDEQDYIAPQVWMNDQRTIPYYFFHFHTIANAVRLEEPHRGFIDIKVHRNPTVNQPYNARIQENNMWIAYFYTRNASWNQYYAMPDVKIRLEAVLEHYLRLQDPVSGSFSEYGWGQYNLAGTTFGLHFVARTVRMLNEASTKDTSFPCIDNDLYDRLIQAYRKALVHVLNDDDHWKHGRSFTNQYGLVWAAAAAYLHYYPDWEIEQQMRQRIHQSRQEFISPAGFYYEANALDMGYNLSVHIQNIAAEYHYFRDTDLEEELIAKESHFVEWLSYNLVIEPDGSFFISNAAPSTRQQSSHFNRKDIPLAEKLPLARAFVKTREEVEDEIKSAKKAMTRSEKWADFPDLPRNLGNAYNPYGLHNHLLYRYYPTEAERSLAIQRLPYIARERFNHQRVDHPRTHSARRSGFQFTYVKRPNYYAAFNAGRLMRQNVRRTVFGLGLLWHPKGGMMISNQTENPTGQARDLSWGTKRCTSNQRDGRVYENGDVLPVYEIMGDVFTPSIGCTDLPDGDLTVQYRLGESGNKKVTFDQNGILVEIDHADQFQECIPLLIRADVDQLEVSSGRVTLIRDGSILEVIVDQQEKPQVETKNYHISKFQMHMVTITAREHLTYRLRVS